MTRTSEPPDARPADHPDRTGLGTHRFDHRDAGTPAAAWRPLLETIGERGLPPSGAHIVALAAHPDDETLGCGAILARAADEGYRVTVIVASFGERSHPESPTHSPPRLAELRRHETREAIAILAPGARLIELALPDGALGDAVGTIEDAVASAAGPGPVWVLAPWEQDRHPDHAACARAAHRMAERRPDCTVSEYPIWAWHWSDPDSSDLPAPDMSRVSAPRSAADRRHRALAVYRSQLAPLSDRPGDEAIVGPHILEHFDRDFDIVIDTRGTARRTGYFTSLYDLAPDPWGIGTRWYEQRKRDLLLACLPRRRFHRAFEPGCAGGHLTVRLAERCDRLVAVDCAARAVALTTERTASHPGVSVERMAVPEHWPAGDFDLLVLSEIGYYFDDLTPLADRIRTSLRPGGVVVLCHWRHPTYEHPGDAAAVHQGLRRLTGLPLLASHVEEDFLLDVLGADGVSVARSDGLVR